MKIQVLKYNKQFDTAYITYNTLNTPQSLDEFDINFIDLNHDEIWHSRADSTKSINVINDLISLETMITASMKSKIIIKLPKNKGFLYNMRYSNKRIELKDMIPDFTLILSKLYALLKHERILYEPTRTKIKEREIKSDFHFDIDEGRLTESIGSNKATTIVVEKIIVTSLDLENDKDYIDFIEQIGLNEKKQSVPEWFKEVKMFDDQKQLDIIAKNNQVIREANDKISDAMTIIDKNNEYKSILYTSGDELVQVVFEILEEMLGCDLSNFKDEKKEDFLFELDGKVYIGEIKGVNHNVKSENVSQLDVHYQGYMDDHPDVTIDNIKALLIMNHQKNKSLNIREKVHDTQINLAKRNGSLIVETDTLLKLFERYKSGLLSRQDCIDTLINSSGLLII